MNGPNDSSVVDAQTSQLRDKKFSGMGSDTDIITSSARAYVSALNKLLTWQIVHFSIFFTSRQSPR